MSFYYPLIIVLNYNRDMNYHLIQALLQETLEHGDNAKGKFSLEISILPPLKWAKYEASIATIQEGQGLYWYMQVAVKFMNPRNFPG